MEVRRVGVPSFSSFLQPSKHSRSAKLTAAEGGASVSECLMSFLSFQKLYIEVGAALVCDWLQKGSDGSVKNSNG